MKSFASGLVLVVGLFLIEASAPVANAQITFTPITRTDFNAIKNPASGQEGGFVAAVDFNNVGTSFNQFGVVGPYLQPATTSGLNFQSGVKGQLTFTNVSGQYTLSMFDGVNTVTASAYSAITPYTDLVFSVYRNFNNPGEGIIMSNIKIDSQSIVPDLMAVSIDSSMYAGGILHGFGNSWSTITADTTAVFLGSGTLLGSLDIQINGLIVPEPSTYVLLIFGSLSLVLMRTFQNRKQPQFAYQSGETAIQIRY